MHLSPCRGCISGPLDGWQSKGWLGVADQRALTIKSSLMSVLIKTHRGAERIFVKIFPLLEVEIQCVEDSIRLKVTCRK